MPHIILALALVATSVSVSARAEGTPGGPPDREGRTQLRVLDVEIRTARAELRITRDELKTVRAARGLPLSPEHAQACEQACLPQAGNCSATDWQVIGAIVPVNPPGPVPMPVYPGGDSGDPMPVYPAPDGGAGGPLPMPIVDFSRPSACELLDKAAENRTLPGASQSSPPAHVGSSCTAAIHSCPRVGLAVRTRRLEAKERDLETLLSNLEQDRRRLAESLGELLNPVKSVPGTRTASISDRVQEPHRSPAVDPVVGSQPLPITTDARPMRVRPAR